MLILNDMLRVLASLASRDATKLVMMLAQLLGIGVNWFLGITKVHKIFEQKMLNQISSYLISKNMFFCLVFAFLFYAFLKMGHSH